MAILMVGLIPMVGLVVDGGAALAARGRAADLADQAARAAADALDPASLRGSSPSDLRISPAAAVSAGQAVLSFGGATGTVSIQGQTVTVTAHVARRAAILSAVGVNDLTGTATATATILHGTTTARP